MAENNRPLSPHLQIYRWQITMTLSILHRATGAGLAVGSVVLAWWLLATAAGPDSYAVFYNVARSMVGQVLLFGWLFAYVYHFLNGIRHLVWDTGRGLDIPSVYKGGYAVIAGSILLTLFIWWFA
jgi:succinate dehydrogenase / fumarate reductase, cytochrome b subunit